MECFVDLQLRPDAEFAPHMLLSALYTKVHRGLASDASGGIAVSFPEYQTGPPTLGRRMRLLGSRAALEAWTAADWLGGLRDHVILYPVSAVPRDAAHRTLRRVQAKSSPARLRRRFMQRHGVTDTQARERIPDSVAEMLPLPFLQLDSGTTGQRFRLFLRLGPVQPAAVVGGFNAYGLSQTATIPWF